MCAHGSHSFKSASEERTPSSRDGTSLRANRRKTSRSVSISSGGVRAIGIDEIAWQRGHKYLTLVYQIDSHRKRLLWVGNRRKIKTLLGFFRWFGIQRSRELNYICSDMWKPYLKVIAKKAGQAVFLSATPGPFGLRPDGNPER